MGTLICDDDKCNAIGTEHCNNGRCVCKSGFDGFHCNSCQEGHFGENCHPVDECCGHELKKVNSLEVDSERRVRRDTVDNTMRNSELRAMIRLDEIKGLRNRYHSSICLFAVKERCREISGLDSIYSYSGNRAS